MAGQRVEVPAPSEHSEYGYRDAVLEAPGRAWAPWLAVLAFVAVAALVGMRTIRNLEIPGQPDLPRYGMQDFRDGFYYPMRAFLDGRNPYSPSTLARHYPTSSIFPLYSPITFTLHLPYGFMTIRTAELVHFLLSALWILGVAFLTLRLAELRPSVAAVFAIAAVVVASRPGHSTLYTGQCAAYLVFATYAALRYARSRPWIAALAFAVASLKPTFGVPLAIVLLAMGAGRAVALGSMIALALAALPAWLVVQAAGGVRPFLRSIQENSEVWRNLPDASGATGVYSIDAIAFVDRLWNIPPAVEVIGTLLLLGLGTYAVARTASRGALLLAECLACFTILISLHHQAYDAVLLALPATALVSGRLLPSAHPALRWGLLALLAVPAFNYLGTYQAIAALGLTGTGRLAVTSASGAATAVAFFILVTVALKSTTRSPAPQAL